MRRVRLDREYIVVVSRDITARKQSDERLREFERVDEMIVVMDRNYRYVLANRTCLRYHGLAKEQVIGRHAEEIAGSKPFESVIKGKLDECFRCR